MTTESEAKAVAEKSKARRPLHREVEEQRDKDIFWATLILRVVNALLLWTFFQPDEYYQAQEPAWALAFGRGTHLWQGGAHEGPWITWEWDNKLRSSLYPIMLGTLYKLFDFVAGALFPPVLRSIALLAPPKLLGAGSAALMEYYLWKLSERIFGRSSIEATTVLYLSALSPWQWFISTRTFSNCFETTLTVIALYNWPWSWFTMTPGNPARLEDQKRLRWAVLFATFASVFRPTNVLIWIVLTVMTLPYALKSEIFAMIRNGVIVGSIVIADSVANDWYYYGEFTLPPLNFLSFNVGDNIADFYGTMRTDYYFTEAIPLLMTTATLFTVKGLYQSLTGRQPLMPTGANSETAPTSILRALAITALAVPTALSFIPHKEVRFIYPILPILLILTARPVVSFFHPIPWPTSASRKTLLILLISFNALIALYLGTFHNAGIIGAQAFLRKEHERLNPGMTLSGETTGINTTQAAFLMPCHSVPWRSRLVYPEIEAWALTCEPPLNLTGTERATYKDEADQFYEDPPKWLRTEMALRRRFWPMYLIFFDALTPDLNKTVGAGSYEEAWRGFNSLAHGDWRRRGDVVVWVKTEAFGGPGRKKELRKLDWWEPRVEGEKWYQNKEL